MKLFKKKGDGDGAERNKNDDKVLEAVLAGDTTKLRAQIEKKKYSSLGSPDDKGRTPLNEACRLNHIECIQLLVTTDADLLTHTDSEGRSVVHITASKGMDECLLALLKANGKANDVDSEGKTPLHHAAFNGHVAAVNALLAYQANTEAKDKNGNTALLCAAMANKSDTAVALINRSSNVNAMNRAHKTSLMFACKNGNADVAKLLLTRGAQYNVKDTGGRSALSYAEEGNFKQVIDLLPKDAEGASEAPAAAARASLSPEAEEELKKLRKQTLQQNSEIDILKAQLAAFSSTADDGDDDDDDVNFDSDEEIDLGDDAAATAAAANKEAKKTIAKQSADIDALKKQIAELQSDNAFMKAAVDEPAPAVVDTELQGKYEALTSDFEASKHEIDALKKEVAAGKAAQAEATDDSVSQSDVEAIKTALEQQLAEAESKAAAASATLETVQGELKASQAAQEAAQEKAQQVQTQLEAATQQAQEAQAKLQAAEEALNSSKLHDINRYREQLLLAVQDKLPEKLKQQLLVIAATRS